MRLSRSFLNAKMGGVFLLPSLCLFISVLNLKKNKATDNNGN